MTNIEQKAVARLECKFDSASDADGKMSFSGYGAVFNNVDSYGDVIAPGAFAKSLTEHLAAGSSPLMFLNHDGTSQLPIGTWTEIAEDGYGLKLIGELLDTNNGRDTYTALKAGAINGLSIGFRPTEFKMRSKPDEPRRTLTAVELVEVSVVARPANLKARVQAVKSCGDELTVRELEEILKDCGLSKSEAVAVASQFESKRVLEDQREMSIAIANLAEKMRA